MTFKPIDLAIVDTMLYLFSFGKACPEILVLPAPEHAFDYVSLSRLL